MVLMKRAYKNIFLVFVIIFGLSSIVFAQDVSLTEADTTIINPSDESVVATYLPELGENSMHSTDYYYGVHAESSSESLIEGVQVKITVEGPGSLTANMVHIDEWGWYDQVDYSTTVFHYPFVAQEDGTLVATGSCINQDDHVCGGGTDTWEVEPLDEFFNVDRISFASNAPAGTYTIRRQLIGSNVSDEYVLTTLLDTQAPVTTKTYGDPNTVGLISVPSCNGNGDVVVNGHFITTSTTITLDATDEEGGSGVANTFFAIKVPVGCEQSEIVEYVGLEDNNIYQDLETCAIAVEGRQKCVETFWELKEEIMGRNDFLVYEGPFVIPQESTHKICFSSTDNAGNEEDIHCQVVLVDDSAPTINSAEVDHEIIDIEYYSGGVYQNNYFDDPKCTVITINATDTHEIDDVQIDVSGVLHNMYVNLNPDSEEALDEYFADDMHDMPSLSNELVIQNDGLYQYAFCPGQHIYHLYMNVLEYDSFSKFLSEDLVLGEFEIPIFVNDTTGKEVETSVDVTIVDLTVPLEIGWNLRSTPIALEGDAFWSTDGIDAVLSWDSATQSWELITDNGMEPLDGLYMHATEENQYGIIFERDLTSPPLRNMDEGWNLVGLALELSDYWYNPEYDGYLTYLSDDYYSCVGSDAFNPLVYDANSNRALEVVMSPYQYLSYGNDWGSWSFYQYQWTWIPDIDEQGADPDNDCEEPVQNFGGYWVLMQNSDLMPGFTTTPLQIYGD